MKRISFCLFALVVLFTVLSCKKKNDDQDQQTNLRIICEELRPFNYVENGKLKGITVEIAGGIISLLGLKDQTIEVTSNWDSAMNLVLTRDNVALFTTSLTEARKGKLQWVGPVSVSLTGFVGLKTSPFNVNSLDDAKKLPSVGVVTGYATCELLEKENFTNLVYFNTINEAVAAVYQGSISSFFEISQPIKATALADGFDINQLKNLYILATIQGYIAFSPGTSPTIVQSWQDKLDQLKTQGSVQEIYNKYLPGEKAPGLITIYTEENPPQNYLDGTGALAGSAVEIAGAMMNLTGRQELITYCSWNAAYDQVLLAPNSMVFSTVLTTPREPLFQWVGPICKRGSCFYVRSNSSTEINSIEEAKQLAKIAVPTGWAAYNEMISLGFTNLVTFTTPQEVFTKLMQNEVDVVVLNDISIDYLANELGYKAGDVRNELLLSNSMSYFAFNQETKPACMQEWQQAYTAIMNNGTFAGIWHKWYPNIDW